LNRVDVTRSGHAYYYYYYYYYYYRHYYGYGSSYRKSYGAPYGQAPETDGTPTYLHRLPMPDCCGADSVSHAACRAASSERVWI